MTKQNPILRYFSLYGKLILLPTIIYLVSFLAYNYVTEPSAFFYEYIDYAKNPRQTPTVAEGVFFYGWQLHEPFTFRQVSLEEYKEIERENRLRQWIAQIGCLLLIFGLVHDNRKRIAKVINDAEVKPDE